jgi:ribosomal protein L35AE/L33A
MNDVHVGVITNYRMGPKSQRNRECLLKVLDIKLNEASKLIGWRVGWPLDEPRLFGIISKPHGRTGTLRVNFKTGLPGQALGTKVKISESTRVARAPGGGNQQ